MSDDSAHPSPAAAPVEAAEGAKQSLTPTKLTFLHANGLSRYVTETGRILPRRLTGLSAKQQRTVTAQIKRGRNMLTMM